jgi:hypothetical protein
MTPFGFPKPSRKDRLRVERREERQETAIKKQVRADCVIRDGYCRVTHGIGTEITANAWAFVVGSCAGVSEWAHFGEKKRFKTRNLSPE